MNNNRIGNESSAMVIAICIVAMFVIAMLGLLISGYKLFIAGMEPFVSILIQFLQFELLGLIALLPFVLLGFIGHTRTKKGD